jgi:hypothetical protein
LDKVTDKVLLSTRKKSHASTVIAAVCVVAASFFLASCSLNLDLTKIGNVIEDNMSGLLPPPGAGFGKLNPPDGRESHEIGSSQDLFFVLQDALYSFSPDEYIQVAEYPMFTRYWEELTVSGALHSAFQGGEVQIEYDNRSPCTIRLIFSYNHCGSVIHAYQSQDDPTFTVSDQIVLDELISNVLEQYVREDMSDYEKVMAIHDYLVVNTVYTESEDKDYLATVLSVLKDGRGQCQGYSEAFAALMIISGVETRIVSGKAFDSQMRFVPHAWNQVKIGGIWYHVDVTWDDPIPDTGGVVLHNYLCRSDEFFKKDHLWSDYFPVCASDNPVIT